MGKLWKTPKRQEIPVFVEPLDKGISKVILSICILAAVVLFFFPLFWLVETAFKTHHDFLAIPPKLVFMPTLQNFKDVLNRSDFFVAYRNSTVISLSAVALAMVFGLPAAYGLSRFRFRGQTLLSFWVLSTRFIPPVVVVIPFFIIFRVTGLSNTLLGMVIVHLVAALPLVIWIMYSFFKDIPFDIEEAACVDGSSPIRTFVGIAVPLVAPGIVATVILALVYSWNELLYAVILTGPESRTLPVAIYSFVSTDRVAWGNLCAAGVLAIAPVVLFTIFVQKYLLMGLTFGAVKS